MVRLVFSVIVVTLLACNNVANNNNTAKVKTQTDSLMDEVMQGHNMAMAKISKLHNAKNEIQNVLDSISNLTADAQKNSVHYKMKLDSALQQLNFADYAMDKWMNEFNMDSEATNTDKRIKYLQSEKTKISKVKDVIISSLKSADSLLKHTK